MRINPKYKELKYIKKSVEKLDYGKIKSNDRKGAWEKSKAIIEKQ